ncbi:MAG: VWA domain-containing protein [Saprospiraceae bacterium]|nr:VWA domain-containing protein [Saprospiraceae bacterium]MCF8251342.1 VWA domain-containing protein [Saprospiraceae bacterium]MCF8280643.1 VWA domain-containing protein [Bacteroidales bacterium]MCF8313217.1 VWA domain-containing protein [Saprospiraceae bacterium]MCF8441619.1 VWA domain-containing protein [Saprospiraceae bacterium]
MFRFEHPSYLYAFALLPLLAVMFWLFWRWRKKAIGRFAESHLVPLLMPEASRWKHRLKFSLVLLAVTFLIVGAANPQWSGKREKVRRKGVDIIIALDISLSMYTQDILPSRIERAKKFAGKLVEELKGNRVGIVYFAGEAYLQMPVTTDYTVTQMFLRIASPDMAGTQGSAIGESISIARTALKDSGKDSYKVLVLITDGEDTGGKAVEEAQKAREEGVIQFTIGVGTTKGAPIPILSNGAWQYKQDDNKEVVLSRLNATMLRDLAEKGGGMYFNVMDGDDAVADALQARIDKLEKRDFEVQGFTSFDSYFQYFVFIALALLVVDWFVSWRKGRLEGRDLFG